MNELKNRIDFVYIFDVKDGNPNGDPDAGNLPRVDAETGMGLVTDVCLKRKVRNYVQVSKDLTEGFDIFIKEKAILNNAIEKAHESESVKNANDKDKTEAARKYMCKNFYDVRTFGAVMTTFVKAALNCGQVRGPVQLGFAKSIDPVISQEVTITRVAITTEKDAEEKKTEIGRKSIIPYALYRTEGYVSANLARKVTGFSEEDLELLWQAIINMFENDHSAARGNMAVRELIVFKHDSELGNCPAYKLFDAVDVHRKEGVICARKYSDYEVTLHTEKIPDSVEVMRKI